MLYKLKYVFYFESLLMSITFLMGLLAPDMFLQQLVPGTNADELTRQLARWYGVPFFPLTAIQLHTLWSGNRYGLKLVMLTYLLTDMIQFGVTIIFASKLGWTHTHLISAGTAVLFIASRGACYRNLERVGVKLTG